MGTTTETRINSTQAKDAIYKAHSISSSASEIDGAVFNRNIGVRKVFDKATNLNVFGKSINIIGDSHTVGIGASSAFLSYVNILRNKLATRYVNFNFGIDTEIGYQDRSYLTWFRNENATDCLTGFYFNLVNGTPFNIIESNSYTPVEVTAKKIRILCPLTEVGKTIEIYGWTGSENTLATLTVGANGLTNEYTSGAVNVIRIRNPSGTPVRIETYFVYDNSSYYSLIACAASSRKLINVDDAQLTRWFTNSEVAILALGTNDNYNATFQSKLDYIKTMYQSQKFTKLIVLDLDITRVRTSETRVALRALANSCKGSIYINVSEYLSYSEATASELYAQGVVKSDLAHYNDNGHEIIANLIYNAINS